MLRIFSNMKKRDWGYMALASAFIVCHVWLELRLPDYMQKITMLVRTEGSAMSEILTAGGWMLLCALGSLVCSVVVAVIASRISSDFAAVLREKLFDRVQSFSMEEIGHFSTASLITRSTNDVTQVQMIIVIGLQAVVKAPIMAAWAIAKIAGKNGTWTMTTGISIAVLLGVVLVCVLLALPRFRRLQTLTDNINRVTREELTGLRVVRAYNADAYQGEKFENANREMRDTQLYTGHVMAFLLPSISFIASALTLAIYWIGAFLIDRAGMMDKVTLFSDMVVFSSYAMQVVMSFMMLVMICIILPRAAVSANRIMEVLKTEPTIHDGEGVDSVREHGTVEFKGVSFKYPDSDDYIVRDISFTAKPGETVALIGATGCGKSTIVNLIPRFYEATEGEVLVDGVDVRRYAQKELRNRIGYVSQRAILFGGTIKSNIDFGDSGRADEITEEEIRNAIRVAQAEDFVNREETGLDGFVAQGGTNLSGGQKQRLSIARAIARKPEIFIFDDSFSALDYRTDKVLRSALNEHCGDATRIIVAQRIGTIRDADRIIVLDEGRIAGMGTHEELMSGCEVYRQIAESQYYKDSTEEVNA